MEEKDDERRMVKSFKSNQGISKDPQPSILKARTGRRMEMGSGLIKNGSWATLKSTGPEGIGPKTSTSQEVVPDALENSALYRPIPSRTGSSESNSYGADLEEVYFSYSTTACCSIIILEPGR
ncbi:hypothetical protein Ancab_028944 [Ancistrocladus abbreviatus]